MHSVQRGENMRPANKPHNNGRIDVRHNTQGQNGEFAQRSARKDIHKTKNTVLVGGKELFQNIRIDTGYWDCSRNPENSQRPDQEEKSLLEFGGVKDICNCVVSHYLVFCSSTVTVPPAFSIAALAVAEKP